MDSKMHVKVVLDVFVYGSVDDICDKLSLAISSAINHDDKCDDLGVQSVDVLDVRLTDSR